MGYAKFGDQIKEVHLFCFAIVAEVVEQFADVRRTGNHFLNHSGEGLKYGVVVNGSEEKLYVFEVNAILSNLFFELDVVLISGVLLGEINVCLVGEDKYLAVIGVVFF